MTVITVDGVGDVEVDATFLDLPPEQQQTILADIQKSAKSGATTGKSTAGPAEATPEEQEAETQSWWNSLAEHNAFQTAGGFGGAAAGAAAGAALGSVVPLVGTALGAIGGGILGGISGGALGGTAGEAIEQTILNDADAEWDTEALTDAAATEGAWGALGGVGGAIGKGGVRGASILSAPARAGRAVLGGSAKVLPFGGNVSEWGSKLIKSANDLPPELRSKVLKETLEKFGVRTTGTYSKSAPFGKMPLKEIEKRAAAKAQEKLSLYLAGKGPKPKGLGSTTGKKFFVKERTGLVPTQEALDAVKLDFYNDIYSNIVKHNVKFTGTALAAGARTAPHLQLTKQDEADYNSGGKVNGLDYFKNLKDNLSFTRGDNEFGLGLDHGKPTFDYSRPLGGGELSGYFNPEKEEVDIQWQLNFNKGGKALSNKISKIHGEGYDAPGQAYAIAKSMGYNYGGKAIKLNDGGSVNAEVVEDIIEGAHTPDTVYTHLPQGAYIVNAATTANPKFRQQLLAMGGTVIKKDFKPIDPKHPQAVPAMVAIDEIMIKPSQARKHNDYLEAINQWGRGIKSSMGT